MIRKSLRLLDSIDLRVHQNQLHAMMGLLTFTHPHFPAALFDNTHNTWMRYRRADTSGCIVDFLRTQGHASVYFVGVDETLTFSFL